MAGSAAGQSRLWDRGAATAAAVKPRGGSLNARLPGREGPLLDNNSPFGHAENRLSSSCSKEGTLLAGKLDGWKSLSPTSQLQSLRSRTRTTLSESKVRSRSWSHYDHHGRHDHDDNGGNSGGGDGTRRRTPASPLGLPSAGASVPKLHIDRESVLRLHHRSGASLQTLSENPVILSSSSSVATRQPSSHHHPDFEPMNKSIPDRRYGGLTTAPRRKGDELATGSLSPGSSPSPHILAGSHGRLLTEQRTTGGTRSIPRGSSTPSANAASIGKSYTGRSTVSETASPNGKGSSRAGGTGVYLSERSRKPSSSAASSTNYCSSERRQSVRPSRSATSSSLSSSLSSSSSSSPLPLGILKGCSRSSLQSLGSRSSPSVDSSASPSTVLRGCAQMSCSLVGHDSSPSTGSSTETPRSSHPPCPEGVTQSGSGFGKGSHSWGNKDLMRSGDRSGTTEAGGRGRGGREGGGREEWDSSNEAGGSGGGGRGGGDDWTTERGDGGGLRKPQRKGKGLVGLENLGNTCFMNSCLQCLSHTIPLVDAFLSSDPTQPHAVSRMRSGSFSASGSFTSRRYVGLAQAFRGVVKQLWSGGTQYFAPVNPSEFLERVQAWAPQYCGMDQHDSQEFLRMLLDGLHEECNRVATIPGYKEVNSQGDEHTLARQAWEFHKSRNDSIIQDIFCGQLQSTIECMTCRRKSQCFDPFLDLSLPIPKRSLSCGGSSITIQDCLSAFTAEERLDGRNKYHCEHCKAPRSSTKKLSIFRLPPILVLHIKRFCGARFSSFTKDSTLVKFCLKGLDLTNFMGLTVASGSAGRRPVYDLYAVSNHSGSLGGGHYTAYCKTAEENSWYSFNDSIVTPIGESSIVSSAAYLLFYQRRE
ncbi:hypothetical protein CBR_g20064 [Chara braunii]|uniref:Ubiquitin carboxyl-terminal hydrolase n=1 Tax=Chara braunii TaxID=69332 RepID=A0A388KZE1_CHABU|nr:hypothetical protein CBR_g20064 [Chara braunii]|eukprot:GBG75434.1 hypothetical protein CBR_g20064 [Chara braunii]